MGNHATPTGDYRARMFWAVWIGVWLVPTLIFGLVPLFEWTHDYEAAMGGLMVALFTGGLTAVGVSRVRWLRRAPYRLERPLPRAARRRYSPLPRPDSAVLAPMRRLAEAEATLEELLDQ